MIRTTIEQIEFWEQECYPVYTNADLAFCEWVDSVVPFVRTNTNDKPSISDITFSILEKPDGTLNTSRFSIGAIEPPEHIVALFREIAGGYLEEPEKVRALVEKDSLYGVGIGVDLEDNERKLYVAYREGDSVLLEGWTVVDGKIIERKIYEPLKEGRGYTGKGERGDRKQIDYCLTGKEAIEFIEKLEVKPQTKEKAIRVLSSGLFALDTVSYSKERGTALYFD